MIDLTDLFSALITLAVSVLGAVLLPLIKGKLKESRLEYLRKWVKIAVYAAEQLYDGEKGEEKKEAVVSFLEKHNITLDTSELDALIESEVKKMKERISD